MLAASLAAFWDQDIDGPENAAGDVGFSFGIQRKKRNGGLSLSWVEPEFRPDDTTTPNPDAGKRVRVDLVNADVVEFGLAADQTRFTFTGGRIKVWRSIPGATLSERDRLNCPYDGPDVVVTLDRSP